MAEIKSWISNHSTLSKSPSLSSNATSSHDSQSIPTLCEDTSFNSLHDSHASSTQTSTSSQYLSKHHIFITSLKTLTSQISCLAVYNNNTLYAASTNEINVFDLTSYELRDIFGSGSGSVKSITFSEDNKIFTSHQDCKIRVWKQVNNCTKHRLISTLPTLKDRFLKYLVPNNYVQVRRHKQKLWVQHADAISGLAVNNDVGLLYSVSWDKSFKIWKISSDISCLESVKAHSDAINAIITSHVDGTVFTGSSDGCVKIWKMAVGKKKHVLIKTLVGHKSSVNALALTSDGSVLYSGGGDKLILAWETGDIQDQEYDMLVKCSLVGHKGAILCLIHVKDVVISGSSDKTVRVWKHRIGDGGLCLSILEGHCKAVKSLVVSSGDPDEDDNDAFTVFSGSLDGEIRVWKIMSCM